MRRIISIMLTAIIATTSAYCMTTSKIRTHARFISDRMAYELDLTTMQYEYCYEINYDFIYNINPFMDDVVMGYTDAIDHYYDYLDMRNEDLRYVLNASQYARFRENDYFYNPIYSNGLAWNFRIYTIYSNTSFFYFDSPKIYKTYIGDHSRRYYSTGYYVNRINHGHVGLAPHIDLPHRNSNDFMQIRKRDFGVNLRERNSPTYNNYSNGNQRNRTQDHRYRDNSGNHNSPYINNPSVQPQRQHQESGVNHNDNHGQQQMANPNNNNHPSAQPNDNQNRQPRLGRRTSNTSNVDTNVSRSSNSSNSSNSSSSSNSSNSSNSSSRSGSSRISHRR